MNQIHKLTFFKKIIILLVLLFSYTSICAYSYVNAISNSLSTNIFRLHIIANSDSSEDQDLKYAVRDEIIKYMNSITQNCTSKEEVISLVYKNLSKFQEIAQKVVAENNFNYNVSVSVGNFSFPTKTYGDIALPAGYYDALHIEIGNAGGQNWWCVLFPPLCFVDVSSGIVPDKSKELFKNNFSDEEFQIVSDNSPEITFKFKLIEFFANVANTLTAKK